MAEHTAGPWTFESYSLDRQDAPVTHKEIVGPAYGLFGQRNLIAEVHMNHENHEADGRLLAAAPDLLEALKKISERDPCPCDPAEKCDYAVHSDGCIGCIARAAIAKAGLP